MNTNNKEFKSIDTGDNSRYPGSRPFYDTHNDRRLFFGREEDMQLLLHETLTTNLVILYAKSGLGKTSLLNAGLSPALRDRDFIIFKARFNNQEIEPLQAVFEGIKEMEQTHPDYDKGEKDSLWQFFKTAAFWGPGNTLLKPVLIMDQFEDFFDLHSLQARTEFSRHLAYLVSNIIPAELLDSFSKGGPFPYSDKPPNIKVIISIREDYLGQLEEMYEDIPGILHHRLRLLPLSREQARQAILEPARVQDQAIKAAPLDFKPDALEMILDFLCKPKDRDSSRITHGVEPFQLQLLCRHLEEKARHKPDEKKGEIEKADLGGEPGMKKVLQNYYEDRLKELGPVWKRRRVRKLFTRGLITPSNRRLSLGVEDIENRFKIKKGLLDDLVNHRLLRSEPRLGSPYYELSHDSLIEPVRNSQKKSRTRNLWMTVGIGFLCVLFIIAYFSPFKKEEIYSISQTLSISQTKTHKAKIEIVEIGPEDAVTHYYKGFEQSLQGKYEEAIKSYEKATNLRKYYVEAYNNWGNVLYTQGKYNEAIEKFNTAIKIDPDYVDAYNGLGSISYKNKEYDEAIDYYEKAIDINKDYPYAYSNLGAVLIEIGNYKEAIENFKKAIEIKRDYLDAYNHWGDALTAQKKYNQAIEIFNQAIDIDPGYVYAYNGLGVASYEMKKYDDAMKYWKKAIRIDPGFAKAYYNMGLALKKRGKNEEAIEKFKKAIESDPDFLYAYYDLGMTLYEMGNYDEAINYFQKAIKIDPGFANAYYEIGIILLYHKKDYNKAIEKFNKVIELEPKAADAYLYKGYSLYHLKNYSESIESFKKAVEICPLPGYKTEYVEFSLLTGHVEEAFSLAKKYLKEKNIPQKNKLIMQFIAITSLLFQGKQPDAAECDELIKYYKSLPEKSHPEGPLIEWDFGEIKEFVNKATDNKLTIKQAERLSKLITILESSKKVPEKEEKKLKELCGIESNNISP